MKLQKFNKLQQKNPNFTTLSNCRFTPKDTTRYEKHNPSYCSTPLAFIHDALMYITPAQIADLFLNSPCLNHVFASLVVPAESLLKLPSFYPSIYDFDIDNNILNYTPEKNPSSSYQQPTSGSEWLRIHTIHAPNFSLSVTILESYLSSHSILISRIENPTTPPPTRTFLCPDAYLLPNPPDQTIAESARLVPKDVYEQLFTYVRAVRTLRVTDPAAFVRTQRQKKEFDWVSNSSWDYLHTFSLLTHTARPFVSFSFYLNPITRFSFFLQKLWRNNSRSILITAYSAPFINLISPFRLSFRNHYSPRLFNFVPYHQTLPNLFHRLFACQYSKYFAPHASYQSSWINYLLQPFNKSLHNFPKFSFLLSKQTIPLTQRLSYFIKGPLLPLITIGLVGTYWYCNRQPHSQILTDNYLEYFHPALWKMRLQCHSVTCFPTPFFQHFKTGLSPFQNSASSPTPSPPPQPKQLSPIPVSDPTSKQISSLPLDSDKNSKNVSFDKNDKNPCSDTESKIEKSSDSDENGNGKDNKNLCPTSEIFDFNAVVPYTPELNSNSVSALESDPSAFGPILPYSSLQNHSFENFDGAFLSRSRISVSELPPPKLNCLLSAISSAIPSQSIASLWHTLSRLLPDSMLDGPAEREHGLSTDHLTVLAYAIPFRATIHSQSGTFEIGPSNAQKIDIGHEPGHWFHPPRVSKPIPTIRGSSTHDFPSLTSSFRDKNNNLLPFYKIHDYTINRLRAKNLSSNIKNDFDGILNELFRNKIRESSFFSRLDSIVDVPQIRTVPLVHLSGFPGCGKSYPVAQLLSQKAFRNSFRVVVPTADLRSEWKGMIKLSASDNWRISTWESALTKHAEVLVLDEVYKMPRGYLDLALIADPSIKFVILLGDPCQTSYTSTNPNSSNYTLESEVQHLAPYRDFYCFWSYRIPKLLADLFSIKTFNRHPGFLGKHLTPSREYPILAPSRTVVQNLQNNGLHSLTYAGSQGTTFKKPVQIFVDRNVDNIHNSTALVALTRSKKGNIFTGQHTRLRDSPSANSLLSMAYNSIQIDFKALFQNELQNTLILTEPLISRRPHLRGGSHWNSIKNRHHRQTQFIHDPNHVRVARDPSDRTINPSFREDIILDAPLLIDHGSPPIPQVSTHFLPETRRPLHVDLPSALPTDVSPSTTEMSDTPFEPVYPGIDYESVAKNLMPPRDADQLDYFTTYRGYRTNQFPYLDVPFEHLAQSLTTISPKHDSKKDPTLLVESIDKRLVFRPSPFPYQISARDELLGHLLFQSLCSAYNRDPNFKIPFFPTLYAECINLNEYSQLSSKTQSVIMANQSRSNPDWRLNVVEIFSKTQHKINEGSLFGPWKACQTLALMQDAVILLFGPIKKYQRFFDKKDRPQNLFVYGGHTPFDISTFCQNFIPKDAIQVCNDYKSFDQSQHGEAVVLERLKMTRLSIPENLVDLHCWIKTNIQSQFGPLTCMRLTGEPGTYDDNTDYNIAVLYSEYLVAPTTAVLVSGDDSAICPEPLINPLWSSVYPLLHLTFKTERTKYGTFCGYHIGNAGAIRVPRPLFVKLILAQNDDTLTDKMASYLSEFVVGHSLGDSFWTLLPFNQVEYQCALFDFFCRHATKEQKVALKIGEVPSETVSDLLSLGFKFVTRPLYALLNRASRLRILHHQRDIQPLVDPLEGVLQL